MKAQAATEYIVIFGSLLLILIPSMIFFANTSSSSMRAFEAKETTRKIAGTADQVYSLGGRMYVDLNIPEGVEEVYIKNKTIVLRMSIGGTTTDALSSVSGGTVLFGKIPTEPGRHRVIVEKVNATHVRIGPFYYDVSITATDINVFLGGTESSTVTVTNLGATEDTYSLTNDGPAYCSYSQDLVTVPPHESRELLYTCSPPAEESEGTRVITLTASSEEASDSTTINLNIGAAPVGEFTLDFGFANEFDLGGNEGISDIDVLNIDGDALKEVVATGGGDVWCDGNTLPCEPGSDNTVTGSFNIDVPGANFPLIYVLSSNQSYNDWFNDLDVADVDSDGNQDVFAGGYFFNQTDQCFGLPSPHHAGDYDCADWLVGSYELNGSGINESELYAELRYPEWRDYIKGVKLGDVDGDGKDELVAAGTVDVGWNFVVYDVDDTRVTFKTDIISRFGYAADDSAWNALDDLALHDIDGDGKLEIIGAGHVQNHLCDGPSSETCPETTGKHMTIGVYEYNEETGNIDEKYFTTLDTGSFYSRILLIDFADVDGDGKDEVIVLGRIDNAECAGDVSTCVAGASGKNLLIGVLDMDTTGRVTEKYLLAKPMSAGHGEIVGADLFGGPEKEMVIATSVDYTCNGTYSTCVAAENENWLVGVYNYSIENNRIDDVYLLTHDFHGEDDYSDSLDIKDVDNDGKMDIVVGGSTSNGGQEDWALGYYTWHYE